MKCPTCDHSNEFGARYCSACGARMSATEQITESIAAVSEEAIEGAEPDALIKSLRAGEAMLVVDTGEVAGSRFFVDEQETTIGRHPDSVVFLDDITVSRRHAVLRKVENDFELLDVGALNGTYCNGQRVDRVALNNGDEIMVGRFRMRFYLGGATLND